MLVEQLPDAVDAGKDIAPPGLPPASGPYVVPGEYGRAPASAKYGDDALRPLRGV